MANYDSLAGEAVSWDILTLYFSFSPTWWINGFEQERQATFVQANVGWVRSPGSRAARTLELEPIVRDR
jgi:hypothetical protein